MALTLLAGWKLRVCCFQSAATRMCWQRPKKPRLELQHASRFTSILVACFPVKLYTFHGVTVLSLCDSTSKLA